VEIIKKFYSHPEKDVAVTETHSLTHYRLFYLVCIQSVVLRRIGGRGHFPSRDKDGGYTIQSAVSKNPT